MRQWFSSRQIFPLLLLLFFLISTIGTFSAQTPQNSRSIQYIYDDKNRLIAVIEPPCERTLYEYDDNGNTTLIKPVNGKLVITSVVPARAGIGELINISGIGFREKAEENRVTFDVTPSQRVPAQVRSASLTLLVVEVPAVPPGPLTITVESPPCEPASIPFEVISINPMLVVDPSSAMVTVNQTQSFTATVTGLGNKNVIWSVNGVVGGDGTVGTITTDGVYTAPASVPNPPSVSVRATSVVISSLFGTAGVTVKDEINETKPYSLKREK